MAYAFWFNMRRYTSEKPRATIAELKEQANASRGYHTYKEVADGKDVAFSDGEAVALTGEPRFYTVPPATMHRGIRD